MPGSSTPAGPTRQAIQRADTAPRHENGEGSRKEDFDPGDLPKATICDGPLWIERERCYQLYEAWCMENGQSASNRAYFGQDLRNLIPKIPDKNCKETVGGVQKRVYRGIGPKSEKTK